MLARCSATIRANAWQPLLALRSYAVVLVAASAWPLLGRSRRLVTISLVSVILATIGLASSLRTGPASVGWLRSCLASIHPIANPCPSGPVRTRSESVGGRHNVGHSLGPLVLHGTDPGWQEDDGHCVRSRAAGLWVSTGTMILLAFGIGLSSGQVVGSQSATSLRRRISLVAHSL